MIRPRRWLITLAICLLVFGSLAVYKVLQIRAAIDFGASFPEPSATVEAIHSVAHQEQSEITTIGEIVAPQTMDLRNEIEGRVVAVNFVAGAIAHQGQVLLQLDISEESARLESARVRAKLAKLNLRRIEKLIKSNTVSLERLDQARAEYDISVADIRTQEARIDKKTLRSPFDARTGLHEFEVGQLVANNTLITTLVGINDYVWVDFNLPQKYASAEIGTHVKVTTVEAESETLQGKIIARDSVMSAASRNLRFRAQIPAHSAIHSNAIVNVILPVGAAQERISVPTSAIRNDALGHFVYVLEAQEVSEEYRARRRSVVLGSTMSEPDTLFVSLLSGLKEGELVAGNGAFKLHDGLLVFIKTRHPD